MFRISSSILLAVTALATALHAQLGPEIAHQHAGRAGDKLAALQALRVEGRTYINGEMVPFTIVARRPNRLRVENVTALRRVVQGYDGEQAPWISHSEISNGAAQNMAEGDARDFMANADFDGPLVDFAAKGYEVDYAGEEQVAGRPAYKLLLMNQGDSLFFLSVDKKTYEVVKRTVFRMFEGRRATVETLFSDFRDAGGVLQPYRIETRADGRLLYAMVIDRITPNPVISPEAFARPGN